MDYFVWLIRNAERTFVVDTGFNAADGRDSASARSCARPRDGLALLGVKAATVKDVIITHMHYDHVGTFFDFPAAQFHLQDDEMSFATGRHMRHAPLQSRLRSRRRRRHGAAGLRGSRLFSPGDGRARAGHERASYRRPYRRAAMRAGATAARLGRARLGRQPLLRAFREGPRFPTTFHVGETLEGYGKLYRLAESPKHIVPGHDPLVMAALSGGIA